MATVENRADFAAVAAVGVHEPDVRVLHGGFAVGEPAPRAAIDDALAVWRPQGVVLVRLRGRQAANAVVGNAQRENVVIEKLVLIGLAI